MIKSLKKLILLLPCLLLSQYLLVAQEMHRVTGTVTDADGEMVGVNIIIKGTTLGTITNFEGYYELDVPSGSTLLFSFVGYRPAEYTITSSQVLDVTLEPDYARLEELVVIGYGVQRKSDLTGSVGHVRADELNTGVLTDPIQGIQGKIAGVSVTKKGGDPNAGFDIKIRGASSLQTSTSPLFVVDGVPGADPTTISPDDIESFNVLKDASAAAIYGSRGAFGVVLITTKRGAEREGSQIDFNSYVSTDFVANRLDLLTGDEYRDFVAGKPELASQFLDGGAMTDWQDEIYRRGLSQNYNLAFSGGADGTTYRASLSHSDFMGVVMGSDKSRTTARINLDQTALDNRLTISSSLSATFERNNYISYGGWGSNEILYQAFQRNPTDPVTDSDGNFYEIERVFQYYNPVNLVEQIHNERDAKRYFGFLKADLEIVTGLTAGVNLAYTRNDDEGFYFEPTTMYLGNHDGYGRRNYNNYESRVLETTLRYANTFDVHSIEAVGGYSFQEEFFTGFRADGRQPFLNYTRMHDLSLFQSVVAGRNIDSYKSSSRLISFFARGVYNYDARYFLTATLRRDGSSKFGVDNEWGLFPSVSVMWNLTNEDFMSGTGVVNNLRLRAGWGITGNQEIGVYNDLLWYRAAGTAPNFETGEESILFEFAHIANTKLKWEENEEINIGMDFGILDNKISGSLDYFIRNTYDLLGNYTVPVPPNIASRVWANVGEFRTAGFEAFVQAYPVRSANLDWRTSFTFLTYNQQVVRLSDDQFPWTRLQTGYLSGPGLVGDLNWTQIVDEDFEIGTWFMPEYAGLSNDGKFLFYTEAGGVTRNLEQAERRNVGSAQPDFELGWSNYVNFLDNFDLNFTFRGVFGYQVFNTTRMIFGNPIFLPTRNVLKDAIDEYDRGLNDNPKVSSYYLEDASFIRLDNISLGYNFSNVGRFERMRVYLASNNVFTLTNYTGIDPEISTTGLSFGLDQYNTYPKTRTVTLGVNVTL
ncbi:MAG: SusC/RagA family TonB-linked outer membrane protein [Marinilabiliales bacterium]|nr:MAG: SusC/RagA family TonB-linked outer membrane protein [Marinilabiliales bacterium]